VGRGWQDDEETFYYLKDAVSRILAGFWIELIGFIALRRSIRRRSLSSH
jgi:hypothetical protein